MFVNWNTASSISVHWLVWLALQIKACFIVASCFSFSSTM